MLSYGAEGPFGSLPLELHEFSILPEWEVKFIEGMWGCLWVGAFFVVTVQSIYTRGRERRSLCTGRILKSGVFLFVPCMGSVRRIVM